VSALTLELAKLQFLLEQAHDQAEDIGTVRPEQARALALAKTKIEEAKMWAEKAGTL